MEATYRSLGIFIILSGVLLARMAPAAGTNTTSYAQRDTSPAVSSAASGTTTNLQFTQSASSNSGNFNNSPNFSYNPEQQISPSNSVGGINYELSITSAQWQADSEMTSYELDPQTLNLVTKLTYNFLIKPRLKSNGGARESLPNGKYLLRAAVMLASSAAKRFSQFTELNRNLFPAEQLVSWTQQIVVAEDGEVRAQVILPFKNATATTIVNDLLLELTPMENLNGKIKVQSVRPTILVGPFFANREGHIMANTGKSRFKMPPKRANTLSSLISDAESMLAHKRSQIPSYNTTHESARAFAAQNNLQLLTMNSPEVQKVLKAEWAIRSGAAARLQSFLTTENGDTVRLYEDRAVMAALCNLMADRLARGGMNYQPLHCLLDIGEYLRVSKNVHVGSLDEKSPEFRRRQLKFNVSGNFMVSRSQSNDVFSGVSINPFAFLLKLVEATGLPSPVNYSYTVSESNSRSRAENMVLSNSTPMDVNTITADIPVKRFLTCVMIRPAPQIGSLTYGYSQPNSGIYLCNTKQEKSAVVTEEYAHVFERINDSAVLDSLSAAAQGINFMLRGDRDLLAFFYSIRMFQSADHNGRYTTNDALAAAVGYLQSTQSAAPGVIGIPVEMTKVTYGAPTAWQKYFGSYQENFLTSID